MSCESPVYLRGGSCCVIQPVGSSSFSCCCCCCSDWSCGLLLWLLDWNGLNCPTGVCGGWWRNESGTTGKAGIGMRCCCCCCGGHGPDCCVVGWNRDWASVSGNDQWGRSCCWNCLASSRDVQLCCCCWVNDGATRIGTACSKTTLCKLLEPEPPDDGNVNRIDGIESRRFSLSSDESWPHIRSSLFLKQNIFKFFLFSRFDGRPPFLLTTELTAKSFFVSIFIILFISTTAIGRTTTISPCLIIETSKKKKENCFGCQWSDGANEPTIKKAE